MTENLPKRQDVPTEKTWNVESVFASADAWEAEFARAGGLPPASPPCAASALAPLFAPAPLPRRLSLPLLSR